MKQEITNPDAIVWREDRWWLGFLRAQPGYWTQGDGLEDLKEHLRDLETDLTSGSIPV